MGKPGGLSHALRTAFRFNRIAHDWGNMREIGIGDFQPSQ